jgi:hypothetical protein
MRWTSDWTGFQQTKQGEARAHRYYFASKQDTGKWVAGYRGYNRHIVMASAGQFDTASEARAYCEQVDRDALIIEGVN